MVLKQGMYRDVQMASFPKHSEIQYGEPASHYSYTLWNTRPLLSLCPELMHITSAYLSLAISSHVAPLNF